MYSVFWRALWHSIWNNPRHSIWHSFWHLLLHIYVKYDMVIDLKVLVRSFNCESRACYVGSPRESFFQVCERNIFSRKFRESWISWLPNIGSAKDKHGVRESCAKVAFLFEKNGRSRTKEFWSTIIFIDIPLFMWHSFWHSIWHHLAYFLTL